MTEPNAAAGPLTGVRVLELSALIAGPSCARYLADHGAEVVKIERYPDGDVSRTSNLSGMARSAMYVQHNAGKQSLCIDLTRTEGRDVVKRLAAKSDVVVEAFTPGVMGRLGLGYEDLKAINPKLVMCSISGFGQTGPNARRPGYAHVAHSMTGWLAMQYLHRTPAEAPRGPGIAIADVIAGITAFGAICAALFRRERTGRGEYLDVALFDSLFAANDDSVQRYLMSGKIDVWYHPVHRTRDGFVTANVGPDFRAWESTCRAIGRPELLDDPRFSTQASVMRHRDLAATIVGEWMAGQSAADAERILNEHHVVCARVLSIEEAARQAQVTERGLLAAVDDPILGRIDVINSAVKFRESSVGVRAHAPTLGEHNESVLRDLLGLSEPEIDAIRAAGVLRGERR